MKTISTKYGIPFLAPSQRRCHVCTFSLYPFTPFAYRKLAMMSYDPNRFSFFHVNIDSFYHPVVSEQALTAVQRKFYITYIGSGILQTRHEIKTVK